MSFPPHSSSADFVYLPVPVEKLDHVLRLLVGLEPEGGAGEVERERLMARVYRESEDQFRALLRLLAEHPGEPRATEAIAAELALPSGAGSLAGMLGAYARRAKSRYSGFWPFERLYNPSREKSELMMEPEIAAFVKQLSAKPR